MRSVQIMYELVEGLVTVVFLVCAGIAIFRFIRKVYNVTFRLIASNGVTVRCKCSKEAGSMFIQALAERNSTIDTNEGKILGEGEFDEYYKKIMETVSV